MHSEKTKGVIYILTNPSFPDYVKIGYAHNIEKRLKQLNRSETIPFAFRVYAVYHVNSELTDKELHKLIDKLNPDLRTIENFDGRERVKEFYAMSVEDAYGLLESIAKISGTLDRLQRLTPEGHEILDEQIAQEVRETAKRGPFRFSVCNIPFGSETTSLSALARKLKQFDHPVQGTLWFSYKGETLVDLRERIECHQHSKP